MILPSLRRIFNQDFPQQFQSLMNSLGTILNNNLENLYTLGANNIALKDNILCDVVVLSVQVDSNGNPPATLTFKTTNVTGTITGITVMQAINQTNSAGYPTGGIFISFVRTQTGVQINNITGLIAGNTYNLTFVVWG